MKNKIIIANWKMNLTVKETEKLTENILKGIKKNLKSPNKIDIVLSPSFTALNIVKKKIYKKSFIKSKQNPNIYLGAQDLFWEMKGSFTGEISPEDLKELNVKYVIIGHSKRRLILQETDEMVHNKVKESLLAGIIPIICVGETFDQRQKGQKDYVIIKQVTDALEGINLRVNQKIIIAYEPVWVIGSGQAISLEEAEYMGQIIHQITIDLYPLPIVRNNIRIVYGGSVDSKNVLSFIKQENIDGVLIGRASLKADEFVKMAKIISQAS